jgi:hypothetical protein
MEERCEEEEEQFQEDAVDEDEFSGDKDEDDEGKATTEFVSFLSEGIGEEIVVDFVFENKNELP